MQRKHSAAILAALALFTGPLAQALVAATVTKQNPPATPATHDVWSMRLCGHWRSVAQDGGQFHENWQLLPNGFLKGRAWQLNAMGEQTFSEKMYIEWRLSQDANGGIYHAFPQGQDDIRFKLAPDPEPHARRWQAPKHDFPQVIRYRFIDGQLETHITTMDDESMSGGRRWRYNRISDCLKEPA